MPGLGRGRGTVDLSPASTSVVCYGGGIGANEGEAPLARIARRASVCAVCVAAYRTHHDSGRGSCFASGQVNPCRVRRNTVSVIGANVDVLVRYDAGRPCSVRSWSRAGARDCPARTSAWRALNRSGSNAVRWVAVVGSSLGRSGCMRPGRELRPRVDGRHAVSRPATVRDRNTTERT